MAKIPKPESTGEATLAFHLKCHGFQFTREVEFCPGRKWRFDFLLWGGIWAIEVEGGTRGNGRHQRHDGFEKDAEKYNEATIMGFKVLRFTTEQVTSGFAIDMILRALS